MICIVLFNLSANFVGATDYYVDNKLGDDSLVGSKEGPLKTISRAMKEVGPGDTVVIVSNGDTLPYLEAIEIRMSGSIGKPITIRGESNINKPVIKGDDVGSILRCYGKHYILVKDLVFKNAPYSGLGFAYACTNIQLEDLELYDVKKNGILINGGGTNFTIKNCIIRRVGNSGIALMGSESNGLSNTVIEGCIISNVDTNDGITFHLDDKGNNVGSNHRVSNNTISFCHEQGIDITAGADFLIENNNTFENNDSGILIDHGASNVDIINHKSERDGKYSIIVGTCKDVSLKSSTFLGPVGNTLIQILGCENLEVDGNRFESVAGSGSRKIIDIGTTSSSAPKNLVFRNNIFLASEGNDSGGMMLRYLGCLPEEINVTWDNNNWYNYKNEQRVFCDEVNNVMNFELFKNKYAQNDSFIVPSIRIQTPKNLKLK